MPSASSCFLLSFFFLKKLFGEVSQNQLEIYVNYFHKGTSPEPGGYLREGGAPSHQMPLGAAHTLAGPGPHLVPSGAVSSCPFAYKFVFDPKT